MTCDRVKTSSATVLRKVTATEQDTDRRIVTGIFEPERNNYNDLNSFLPEKYFSKFRKYWR